MQGIYKIENLINGKCYVGQSIHIKTRWREHKSSHLNYPLYKAFRKYGIENFHFSVLEIVKEKDDLTPRELYWYEKLKPEYNNMKPAEDLSEIHSNSIYQIDVDTLEIIQEWESSRVANKALGIDDGNIRSVCNRSTTTAGGYYWCKVEGYETWEPRQNKPHVIPKGQECKAIARLDKDTEEVLEIYESALKASEQGFSRPRISEVCNGKRKTHSGFKWKFVK